MTIDITPEAVENLWRYWANKAQALADENKALSAALTASQAETAAVYELVAAKLSANIPPSLAAYVHQSIIAITPADSKAAFDRMIAAAWADGMREAASIVARHGETGRKNLGASQDLGTANIWSSIVARCDMIGEAILAAIPKGKDHE